MRSLAARLHGHCHVAAATIIVLVLAGACTKSDAPTTEPQPQTPTEQRNAGEAPRSVAPPDSAVGTTGDVARLDSVGLDDYRQFGGEWGVVGTAEGATILTHTENEDTVVYVNAEEFTGSYEVAAAMWNEDDDAAGLAFRVDPADADNFYSCSATADDDFQAGLWRHVDDVDGPPTALLGGVSWEYVRERPYIVTVTVDTDASTIRCQWESEEAGIELDVTVADPDPSVAGSVGIWLSSQDDFRGELLAVRSLAPTETTPPVVEVVSPAGSLDASDLEFTFSATDDTGISRCGYELDGVVTELLTCANGQIMGLSLGSLALANHTLHVFATDPSGNTGTAPVVEFTTIDDVSPPRFDASTALLSVPEGRQLSHPIVAADNDAVVLYTAEGSDDISVDPATGLLTSNGALPLGDHLVVVTARDRSGNTAGIDVTVSVFTGAATPNDFVVAFLGDQGSGPESRAVLELIRDQGADMVLHQGDFDYDDDPARWDGLITAVLGADFPYFASVGNHDADAWAGPGGYQDKLRARLERVPEAECSGDYGVKSACTYNGLFFILSGVGEMGTGHAEFIRDQLANSPHRWRVCSWHKNMTAFQVGGKDDDTGWQVYEECRLGGAMIATGHEHSYHRTKTLIDMANQTVDPEWSQPDQVRVGPGATFAFVSGLGGRGVREQQRCLPATPPYGCGGVWASIYAADQGANSGALFCTFAAAGSDDTAQCVFRDIAGNTPDQFTITSFNSQ